MKTPLSILLRGHNLFLQNIYINFKKIIIKKLHTDFCATAQYSADIFCQHMWKILPKQLQSEQQKLWEPVKSAPKVALKSDGSSGSILSAAWDTGNKKGSFCCGRSQTATVLCNYTRKEITPQHWRA